MTITPIRIGQNSLLTKYRTSFSFGGIRSGKAYLAGTFPNSLIIAPAIENGWVTLEVMYKNDPGMFYHRGQGPVILPIADQQDMTTALSFAEKWVRAGYVDTLVFDGISLYADLWFAEELRKMTDSYARGGKPPDVRSLYGAVNTYMLALRDQVHKLPCNVLWVGLAALPEDDVGGGPLFPGKQLRSKFPAVCDYVFFNRKYVAVDENEKEIEVFEIRTKVYGRYDSIGGRDGGALTNPMPWPTFRAIAECLELPEFPPKMIPDAELAAAFTVLGKKTIDAIPTLPPEPANAPVNAAPLKAPPVKSAPSKPARN